MVGPDGFEPSTPRLSSACSNQLSYEPGLKKSLGESLGEAEDTASRKFHHRLLNRPSFAKATEGNFSSHYDEKLVEPAGFEPATPCLQSRCSAS